MAKSSKGGRKPPEASGSHQEIADWMKQAMPDLQPVLQKVDQLIRDEHGDELQYALKWKKAYYGLPERGWVIEMAAYDVSVNVVFHGGADFSEPPPMGDTGKSRYIKLKSVEEADTGQMRDWIRQAGTVSGWQD